MFYQSWPNLSKKLAHRFLAKRMRPGEVWVSGFNEVEPGKSCVFQITEN